MKSILIIGMGKFGHHLCENLLKLGNDVMAVDISEDKVADMIYKVTNIQIGDCTNPQVVRSFGVGNFDIVLSVSEVISRTVLKSQVLSRKWGQSM